MPRGIQHDDQTGIIWVLVRRLLCSPRRWTRPLGLELTDVDKDLEVDLHVTAGQVGRTRCPPTHGSSTAYRRRAPTVRTRESQRHPALRHRSVAWRPRRHSRWLSRRSRPMVVMTAILHRRSLPGPTDRRFVQQRSTATRPTLSESAIAQVCQPTPGKGCTTRSRGVRDEAAKLDGNEQSCPFHSSMELSRTLCLRFRNA